MELGLAQGPLSVLARRLIRMTPEPTDRGSVRSAEVVNEAIRALVRRAQGRAWTQAERTLYGLWLEEWSAALQADVVQAA